MDGRDALVLVRYIVCQGPVLSVNFDTACWSVSHPSLQATCTGAGSSCIHSLMHASLSNKMEKKTLTENSGR